MILGPVHRHLWKEWELKKMTAKSSPKAMDWVWWQRCWDDCSSILEDLRVMSLDEGKAVMFTRRRCWNRTRATGIKGDGSLASAEDSGQAAVWVKSFLNLVAAGIKADLLAMVPLIRQLSPFPFGDQRDGGAPGLHPLGHHFPCEEV